MDVVASTFAQVDALRKLVRECGVDSKGSKMDLLLRLREEMKTRSTYDKVFQKVWGASGKCPMYIFIYISSIIYLMT